MCTPNGLLSNSFYNAINTINDVGTKVSEYKTNKANYAYRTQVALNNAKMAQNEAMRQKQLGIEKSRVEKIAGIKELNTLKAKNSASNLDLTSETNLQAYQDTLDMSKLNAGSIAKEYDVNAKSYFAKANDYLNEANSYKKEYKNSLWDFSLNSLGGFGQVASEWYGGQRSFK